MAKASRTNDSVKFTPDDLEYLYAVLRGAKVRESKVKVFDNKELFDIEYVQLAEGVYICSIFADKDYWLWNKDTLRKAIDAALTKVKPESQTSLNLPASTASVQYRGATYRLVKK